MSRHGYHVGALAALLLALTGCAQSSAAPVAAGPTMLAPDHVSAEPATHGFDPEQLPGTRTSWNDAALVGPHFVLEIDTMAHAQPLPADLAHRWGLAKGVRAADGDERLLSHNR